MLTKEKPARERILLIGSFGAGKSNAWCTIGSWLRRTKSPARMFVVDTDHAADRLGEGYDGFYENTTAINVWDYKEAKDAVGTFKKNKPNKEDWLVVDLADKLWGYTQDYFIEQAYGKDSASYFLEFKKAQGKGNPLSQEAFGADWQKINQLYNSLMTDIQRWPGHIMFCCPAVPTTNAEKGGDDKETLALFGGHGVKPAGQKALGFQFFTILWMIPKTTRGKQEWVFTSIKDLNRDKPSAAPMTDFVMDYLVPIAGWSL